VKQGDWVKWSWKGDVGTNGEIKLTGLVLGVSKEVTESDIIYRDVWWMSEDRVSPIDPQYLEVISEYR
jgi:hypothetical protein